MAVLAILMAIVTLQLHLAPPAHATNFGSTNCVAGPGAIPRNCVSLMQDASVDWCERDTLGDNIPGLYTAFVDAMSMYNDDTDLTTIHRCPVTSDRDLIVEDAGYGQNMVYGWAECVPGSAVSGSHPTRRCDQQRVRFNASYQREFDGYARLRSLSCHEVGHTVGLRHTGQADTNSCLDNFSSTRSTVTSNHDDSHINANH